MSAKNSIDAIGTVIQFFPVTTEQEGDRVSELLEKSKALGSHYETVVVNQINSGEWRIRPLLNSYLNATDMKALLRWFQFKRLDPSVDDHDVLIWAAQNNQLPLFHELLKHNKVDVSARDNFALKWAASEGHLDIVKTILEGKRMQRPEDLSEALRLAARKGRLDIVKLLITTKQIKDLGPAMVGACSGGHLSVVEYLLSLKVPAGERAIWGAVIGHHKEVVRLCLKSANLSLSEKKKLLGE